MKLRKSDMKLCKFEIKTNAYYEDPPGELVGTVVLEGGEGKILTFQLSRNAIATALRLAYNDKSEQDAAVREIASNLELFAWGLEDVKP